jgi:hypothetical protein
MSNMKVINFSTFFLFFQFFPFFRKKKHFFPLMNQNETFSHLIEFSKVDLPEIKGQHRKFRTLVTSYIGKVGQIHFNFTPGFVFEAHQNPREQIEFKLKELSFFLLHEFFILRLFW